MWNTLEQRNYFWLSIWLNSMALLSQEGSGSYLVPYYKHYSLKNPSKYHFIRFLVLVGCLESIPVINMYPVCMWIWCTKSELIHIRRGNSWRGRKAGRGSRESVRQKQKSLSGTRTSRIPGPESLLGQEMGLLSWNG